MIGPEFIAIWIAWIMAGGSPGPATMGIAGTAMSEGRRAAVTFALGILAGGALWGISAALGLSALMQANAWLYEVIRYIGVAYLAWLAVKAFKRAITGDSKVFGTAHKGSTRSIFLKGMAIHLTNPKAILSWGGIYALIAPDDATTRTLLTYFVMLYSGSIMVFISYAFLFSSKKVVRAYVGAQRWFDLAFAGFFGFASYKILMARL